MNKKIIAIPFFFIACTLQTLDMHVPESLTHETPIRSLINNRIIRFMKQHKIPGASVVIYTDDTPYFFNFGYANQAKKTPVTRNTIFEVGSISKLFTCLLLAQEIMQGTMQLTDPISSHIPALSPNKSLKTMSLEKLATHTSHLPFNAPECVCSTKGLLNHIARWHPASKTPTWCYSNHGVELLRIALEEECQEPINDLIVSRILQPLGMTPIGTNVPYQYQHLCATGYDKAGAAAAAWPPARHNSYLIGSAAMRATPEDMLQFLKLSLDCQDIDETLRYAMHITQTPRITIGPMQHGLGWQITPLENMYKKSKITAHGSVPKKVSGYKQVFNGNALFEKTGTTEGFHAYIAAIPSQKKGVVIMVNHTLPNGWRLMKKIGRDLLSVLD